MTKLEYLKALNKILGGVESATWEANNLADDLELSENNNNIQLFSVVMLLTDLEHLAEKLNKMIEGKEK